MSSDTSGSQDAGTWLTLLHPLHLLSQNIYHSPSETFVSSLFLCLPWCYRTSQTFYFPFRQMYSPLHILLCLASVILTQEDSNHVTVKVKFQLSFAVMGKDLSLHLLSYSSSHHSISSACIPSPVVSFNVDFFMYDFISGAVTKYPPTLPPPKKKRIKERKDSMYFWKEVKTENSNSWSTHTQSKAERNECMHAHLLASAQLEFSTLIQPGLERPREWCCPQCAGSSHIH